MPSHFSPELSQLENALEMPRYDGTFADYLHALKIAESDLRGFVLDLGSGATDRFSREAGQRGIQVVSLDPHLVEDFHRDGHVSGSTHLAGPNMYTPGAYVNSSHVPSQERSVAALSQNLPFNEESFDTIVSFGAVPVYLPPRVEDYLTSLEEIYRVLKPGGVAHLGPFAEHEGNVFSQATFEQALQASGIPHEITSELYEDDWESVTLQVLRITK